MAESVQRNSTYELLRIISIYLIIVHHFIIYGDISLDTSEITITMLWYRFILMLGPQETIYLF